MNSRKNELLVKEITEYMNKRKKEFCGGLFGSFTKCQKVNAAEALRNYIEDPNSRNLSLLIRHLDTLNQGRLNKHWISFLRQNPDQFALIRVEADKLKTAKISESKEDNNTLKVRV